MISISSAPVLNKTADATSYSKYDENLLIFNKIKYRAVKDEDGLVKCYDEHEVFKNSD